MMPFRSEAQRAYLYAKHPEVAKKFAAEHGNAIHPSESPDKGYRKGTSYSPKRPA